MSIASDPRTRLMTPEEFLAWEAEQEERYEFIDGRPRLMAGGTHAHHVMALNIAVALRARLSGPCTPLLERKLLTQRGNYRYPDVLVDCGKPSALDLAAYEPRVVFEVVSPSNTMIDEFERLEDFQATPSILQIVILSQHSMRGRIYTRDAAGWSASTLAGDEAVLDLSAIGCELPFAQIYERVEFMPTAANG